MVCKMLKLKKKKPSGIDVYFMCKFCPSDFILSDEFMNTYSHFRFFGTMAVKLVLGW